MKWGAPGSGNGQFSFPSSVVVDGGGNVYVADTNNHRIQALTTTGTFLSTLGAYGSGEGQFKYPRGIAMNENGKVYVADTNNHRIQIFKGESDIGPLFRNAAPAANAGEDIAVTSVLIAATIVNGEVTDPDGDPVSCRWTETDVTGNVLSVLKNWAPAGSNGECPLQLSALSLGRGVHFLRLGANDGQTTSSDDMVLTINNTPPVADAGDDLTVETTIEAAATVIPGRATDFDGDNLSCRWLKETTVLQTWAPAGSNGECPLQLSALSLGMGIHTLTLEASDGQTTSSDDMVLTINNTPPVADAGDDISIPSDQVGATTIQGTVTDVDLAYTFTCRWLKGTTVLLAWAPAGSNGECPLQLSALSLGIGVHVLTLEANDGQTTSSDTMTLTIHNSVPNADAGNNLIVTTEETRTTVIHGSATDFDGNELSCRWMEGTTSLQDWTPAGQNGECPLDLSALSLGIGMHTLTLTARDGLATSSDDMVLTINNTPPVADAGENIAITSAAIASTTIHGIATDFDRDTLSCSWAVDGTPLPALSGIVSECPLNLSGLALGVGLHILTLQVNDGESTSSDEMLLTIDNSAPNAAPGGSGVYGIGTPVILSGDISDFDGDTLIYVWESGTDILCSGSMQSIAGGAKVQLPDCAATGLDLGIHTISLGVSDGVNPLQTSSVTVQVTDTSAPTLKPEANTYILWPPNHNMVNIAIAANASDNSGSTVVLNATVTSNEPEEGLGEGDIGSDWTEPVINQATGMITMQLRAERSGRGDGRIYTVTITATDPSDNISTAKVNILVPHDQKK
ncbi:hypothetical protein NBG4_1020008 [Candidatus Sulfobium mesophilum]|uniref:NHL repeat containing protein n=1 Tax=Candidatus Sulfobium mesophilum TaxID=2016548 RepID=A0A2U3QE78_9BACT|nr:hypothetical protein NBG4_1020008 [Candidatus Sulfobium mesophilum]